MENFIFLLSESWSPSAAGRLLDVYNFPLTVLSASVFQNQFFGMLRLIGSLILVSFLAWFMLKKMAGAKGIGRKCGNLAVVESINLAGSTVAQIIKAGDKYLVIGITKEQVTLLAEIDGDSLKEAEIPDFSSTPFGAVLSRFMQPKPDEKEEIGDDDEKSQE